MKEIYEKVLNSIMDNEERFKFAADVIQTRLLKKLYFFLEEFDPENFIDNMLLFTFAQLIDATYDVIRKNFKEGEEADKIEILLLFKSMLMDATEQWQTHIDTLRGLENADSQTI